MYVKLTTHYIQILVHIADAPAHGQCFHSEGVSDNHLEEDLLAFNPLMAKIKEQNIAYWFGYIQKRHTDMMVEQLDKLLQTCKADGVHSYITGITQFDAVNPEMLLEALEGSITETITVMERSVNSRNLQKIPYTILKGSPSFTPEDSEDIEPVCIFEYTAPSRSDRDPIGFIASEKSLALSSTRLVIKKAKQPFSEGAEHIVYHALKGSSGERLVIKESKFQRSLEERKGRYLTVIQIYGVADYYAKMFNAQKPRNTPEIYFNEVKFCEQNKKINGTFVSVLYLYEKYMEGRYVKYNSNNGGVCKFKSEYSDASQAFSHYTWVNSGKQLVVCDLQGVTKSNKIFLTDPAIHTKECMLLKSGINLGPPGIKTFFASHKCNSVCKKMELQLFDK